MATHAGPLKRHRNAPTDETSGGNGWLTGECGHSWWGYNIAGAVGSGASLGVQGKKGRSCPECGHIGPVRQARTDRRSCAGGCGTVLSVYNRHDTCSRCG